MRALEEKADAVIYAVLAKIKAMEKRGVGLISASSVTSIDRLAVIIGSVPRTSQNAVIDTIPLTYDIERVLSIAKSMGLELGKEEVILLSKLRRFVLRLSVGYGLWLPEDRERVGVNQG